MQNIKKFDADRKNSIVEKRAVRSTTLVNFYAIFKTIGNRYSVA